MVSGVVASNRFLGRSPNFFLLGPMDSSSQQVEVWIEIEKHTVQYAAEMVSLVCDHLFEGCRVPNCDLEPAPCYVFVTSLGSLAVAFDQT